MWFQGVDYSRSDDVTARSANGLECYCGLPAADVMNAADGMAEKRLHRDHAT